MIKPYQFIGYWGSSQEKLEAVLKKVLNKTANKLHIKVSGKSWGVAYIGIERERSKIENDRGIIASISASGLANTSDAWVKVESAPLRGSLQDRLILGREPFGRVPLYWTQTEEGIWFASRVKLLLPLFATAKVSISGLYGYSCFSYFPTPLTPVEGIFSISAGTEQIWESIDKFQTKYIYQWRSKPVLIQDEAEAVFQLQTLLKNSVRKQLEDLPSETVGVFLSGGLDSSTIAALLARSGVKVRAYTLDFGSFGISETPQAQQVADYLNIPLQIIDVTPKKIKQALIATTEALDLPFGDGVTVPLYLLCQAASQETGVIFNGEGGDQLFAGWTNKPIIAASLYNTENLGGKKDFTQQYLDTFHRLYGYETRVFRSEVCEQISPQQARKWIEVALDSSFSDSLLDRLRRATLMLKGAQNIHPRATNIAFSNGLWVRSPFCDLPLAEWTFGVAGDLFLQGACEKYILKRAVESWLPEEIVWREKRGMGVPLSEWLLKDLWSEISKWLNPSILQSEGRFVCDLPMQVILGQLSGQFRRRRIGEILWLLIIWEVWRIKVLGETAKGRVLWNPFWLSHWFWRIWKRWRSDF